MPLTAAQQRVKYLAKKTCGNCSRPADAMRPWGAGRKIPICALARASWMRLSGRWKTWSGTSSGTSSRSQSLTMTRTRRSRATISPHSNRAETPASLLARTRTELALRPSSWAAWCQVQFPTRDAIRRFSSRVFLRSLMPRRRLVNPSCLAFERRKNNEAHCPADRPDAGVRYSPLDPALESTSRDSICRSPVLCHPGIQGEGGKGGLKAPKWPETGHLGAAGKGVPGGQRPGMRRPGVDGRAVVRSTAAIDWNHPPRS